MIYNIYPLTLHIDLITVLYFYVLLIFNIFPQNLGKIRYFFMTYKTFIFKFIFHLYDLFCVISLLLSLFVTKYNNFKGIKKISSLNI